MNYRNDFFGGHETPTQTSLPVLHRRGKNYFLDGVVSQMGWLSAARPSRLPGRSESLRSRAIPQNGLAIDKENGLYLVKTNLSKIRQVGQGARNQGLGSGWRHYLL